MEALKMIKTPIIISLVFLLGWTLASLRVSYYSASEAPWRPLYSDDNYRCHLIGLEDIGNLEESDVAKSKDYRRFK